MDITPFTINFSRNGNDASALIRPCCSEDNVVDYAVWQDGKFLFTVTKNSLGRGSWVIALKNADDVISHETVQAIGAQIEKRIITVTS